MSVPILVYAVNEKCSRAAELLLAKGASLAWTHPETGNSLFLLAAERGVTPVILQAINARDNPALMARDRYNIDEQRSGDRKNALMIALEGNTPAHMEVVAMLHQAGARTDLFDAGWRYTTHYAADADNIPVLRYYQATAPHLLNKQDAQGMSPLLLAAAKGTADSRRTVLALINETSADVNITDAQGRSVIAYAAKHGWPEVIEAALAKGGNPDLGRIDGKSPVLLAIEAGDTVSSKHLIEGGADLVSAVDPDGNRILHMLARKGMSEFLPTMIRILKDPEALDRANNRGETPALVAAAAEQWGFVNKALELGANPHAATKETQTTLAHYAAKFNKRDMMARFTRLENFDPSAGTLDGKTMLQLAVGTNDPDLCRMIPNLPQIIDRICPNGETALTQALKSRAVADGGKTGKADCPKTAEWLLRAGASLTQTNFQKESPFALALLSGMEQLLPYFLEREFDTGRTRVNGESILFHLGNVSQKRFRAIISDFRDPRAHNKHGYNIVGALIAGAAKDEIPEQLDLLLEEIVKLKVRGGKGDAAALAKWQGWAEILNEQDPEGNPPIHAALLRFHSSLTKQLLWKLVEAGAQPNSLNAQGQTPLILTTAKGWKRDFEILLDHIPGVKADLAGGHGVTPLMTAAAMVPETKNDKDTARESYFIDRLISRVGSNTAFVARNAEGKTAAHIAAGRPEPSFEQFKKLIPQGFPLDLADNDGNTVLLAALKTGRPNSARFMLARGSDPSLANAAGENAFVLALTNNVKLFAKQREGVLDALMQAAAMVTNKSQAERLHKMFNDPAPEGIAAALMSYAASHPEHAAKTLQAMLRSGMNANLRLASGESLLGLCLGHANADFALKAVPILLAEGADADQPAIAAPEGGAAQYPVDIAFEKRSPLLGDILSRSAHKNRQDAQGRTILIRAIDESEDAVLHQSILNAGVDPNIADNNLDTALHHAVRRGQPSTFALLVESGADVLKRNSAGLNPVEEVWRLNSLGQNITRIWEGMHEYFSQRPMPRMAEDSFPEENGAPLLHILVLSDKNPNIMLGAQHLLAGANPVIKDGNGDTLLTALISRIHVMSGTDEDYLTPYLRQRLDLMLTEWIPLGRCDELLKTPGSNGMMPAELARHLKQDQIADNLDALPKIINSARTQAAEADRKIGATLLKTQALRLAADLLPQADAPVADLLTRDLEAEMTENMSIGHRNDILRLTPEGTLAGAYQAMHAENAPHAETAQYFDILLRDIVSARIAAQPESGPDLGEAAENGHMELVDIHAENGPTDAAHDALEPDAQPIAPEAAGETPTDTAIPAQRPAKPPSGAGKSPGRRLYP